MHAWSLVCATVPRCFTVACEANGAGIATCTRHLVDADGDGHVDILVHLSDRWNCSYDGGPVTCLGSAMRISGADNNWAPGPTVQNQLNFRPGAVNSAGQILYDPSVRRDFRQQIQQGTVIDPRIAQGTTFTYKANDGAADSAPATAWA